MTAPLTTAPGTALLPCPFCGEALTEPTAVQYPKMGLARLHPNSIDDGSCPIAGWGFYGEQLETWNTRAPALQEHAEELAEALSTAQGNMLNVIVGLGSRDSKATAILALTAAIKRGTDALAAYQATKP